MNEIRGKCLYYIQSTNMDFKIKCFTWSIFQILCTQVKTRPIALSEDGEYKELLTTARETEVIEVSRA